MSERKVLNKYVSIHKLLYNQLESFYSSTNTSIIRYFPPDWDPAKIPKRRQGKGMTLSLVCQF